MCLAHVYKSFLKSQSEWDESRGRRTRAVCGALGITVLQGRQRKRLSWEPLQCGGRAMNVTRRAGRWKPARETFREPKINAAESPRQMGTGEQAGLGGSQQQGWRILNSEIHSSYFTERTVGWWFLLFSLTTILDIWLITRQLNFPLLGS